MNAPDLELRALIRDVVAHVDLTPPSLDVEKIQLSGTALKVSKITVANAHSQACIHSLSLVASTSATKLDLACVKDLCTAIECVWDDVVYYFDGPLPGRASVKETKKFEDFRKHLRREAKKFGENVKFYVYSTRSEAGDRTAVDQLILLAVYLLKGLLAPARAFNPREGNGVVADWSKLDDLLWKCRRLTYETFTKLEKRLLVAANAEDWMYKLINTLQCTIGVLENHPEYKISSLVVHSYVNPAAAETYCQKQVAALRVVIDEKRGHMDLFQGGLIRNRWKVLSYAKGSGSDASQAAEPEEKMYIPIMDCAHNEKGLDVEATIVAAQYWQTELGSTQLQLLQRLRPFNEPCFVTGILTPDGQITMVGSWRLKGKFQFLCRVCEGEITWGNHGVRPETVRPQVLWKSDRGSGKSVHEHYAVAHHLPAVEQKGMFGGKGGSWEGKGEAKLYCGYCFKWELEKPVDQQFVFGNVLDFYQHLHKMHDFKEKDSGCCVIL